MCRDTDVKEECFLEFINQLVMTGEVAGLFPKDEMDALLNDVRSIFKRERPGGHCGNSNESALHPSHAVSDWKKVLWDTVSNPRAIYLQEGAPW